MFYIFLGVISKQFGQIKVVTSVNQFNEYFRFRSQFITKENDQNCCYFYKGNIKLTLKYFFFFFDSNSA